ncbi:Late embryogenesis abundant protein [Sesbania bispinosa]|nr:Late embryogenesis abundant protein [Sesbania bispinosa]
MPPSVRFVFSFLWRVLFACFLAFFLIYAVIVFIKICLVLTLKPYFIAARLDSAIVTSLNTTNNTNLTATFDFTVIFQNPNQKLSVSYKNLEAKVWFGNDNFTLASTPLPPFSQEIKTETKVQAHMVVVDGYIDGGVAKEIAQKRAHGPVSLGVKVLGLIRFNLNSSIFHTRHFPLKVTCEPVVISFPPDKNNNTGTLVAPFNCYAI